MEIDMDKAQFTLFIEAIKQSNLHPTTKSFLSAVLKDLKSETDAAWAQRGEQLAAKRKKDEEAAYDWVESPSYRKVYPDKYVGKVSRMTPDPEAIRPADQSDIDDLAKHQRIMDELRAQYGDKIRTGVPSWQKKMDSEKGQFQAQADDLYRYEYGPGFEQSYIEQFGGDPRFAEEPDEEQEAAAAKEYDEYAKEEDELDFDEMMDNIAAGR